LSDRWTSLDVGLSAAATSRYHKDDWREDWGKKRPKIWKLLRESNKHAKQRTMLVIYEAGRGLDKLAILLVTAFQKAEAVTLRPAGLLNRMVYLLVKGTRFA